MRFVLVGLAVLCLIVAFVTSSTAILGFCLLAAVLLSLGAVFVFAQARIDSTQHGDIYLPTPEERELMRKTMEQRKQAASAAPAQNDDDTRATP